jgi:hypothetical protein
METSDWCIWIGRSYAVQVSRSRDGRCACYRLVWRPNEQGLIVERTVALRPYPALKLFRDAMYASLKDKLPPDVWDYPTP